MSSVRGARLSRPSWQEYQSSIGGAGWPLFAVRIRYSSLQLTTPANSPKLFSENCSRQYDRKSSLVREIPCYNAVDFGRASSLLDLCRQGGGEHRGGAESAGLYCARG